MKNKVSEIIVKAAIKHNNKIYTGYNHGECFGELPTGAVMQDSKQGFVTNEGRFVNRKEAYKIATTAHQITALGGTPANYTTTLISEDLQLNWLHTKDQQILDLQEEKDLLVRALKKVLVENIGIEKLMEFERFNGISYYDDLLNRVRRGE